MVLARICTNSVLLVYVVASEGRLQGCLAVPCRGAGHCECVLLTAWLHQARVVPYSQGHICLTRMLVSGQYLCSPLCGLLSQGRPQACSS